MTAWGKPKHKNFPRQRGGSQGWGNMILSKKGIIPSSRAKNLPPLNVPIALLKVHVHLKIAHSLIPFLCISFTTLTYGILVSYIKKNSINSWRDSRKIIHSFVTPGIINSSTARLATLKIMKTSLTWGWIDTYLLTYPYVTAVLW